MKIVSKIIPILLFLLIGCEKIIYIPIDKVDLKIVLSGVLNPDSTVVVAISSTEQLIMPDPYAPLPDSMIIDQISLYEDDQLVGNLEYLNRIFYTIRGFKPSKGKTYQIEVSAKDRSTVKAVTTIPDSIPINFLTSTITKINQDTTRLDVDFKFSDPVDQTNFYALEVYGLQNYYDRHNDCFTDSLVFDHYYPKINGKSDDFLDLFFLDVNQDVNLDDKLFFSDQIINGQDFKIQFSILRTPYNHIPDSVDFYIKLQQVDSSYYNYAVSEKKYRKAVDNPFSEPVLFYTNVSNGYGLFTSYNESVREIKVRWAN